jgi:zinc/manganese transport system substrate-binding protein
MQRRVCLKRLWILLSALCLVGLSVRSAQAELKVVATLEQYGSIAKTIGGDRVKVSALVKGYQNPHAVEVKPSYSVLLNKADLLVANGQLIEVGWLDNALINARNLKVMEGESGFVDCSIGVDIIPYEAQEIEGTPFFMLNLSTGGTVRLGNHHYWLDPGNNEIIARNIYERFAAVDPGNAAFYKANYERFAAQLREKLQQWDAMMASFQGAQIVSYHRSWTYLVRRHRMKVFDYIEPKETIPPSAAYMASLVDRMKRSGVKIILAETYQDRKIVEEVARLTSARALMLPASVSEDPGIRDVFQLFDRIYRELAQALQAVKAS